MYVGAPSVLRHAVEATEIDAGADVDALGTRVLVPPTLGTRARRASVGLGYTRVGSDPTLSLRV